MHRMPRLLLLAIATLWFSNSFGERPPNILLILADDLGIECLGCTGGETYLTPNIDALAKSGMLFDHAYSTPKCSPSRVTLLTGRYTFRTTRAWGNIPRSEISFANQLKKAGYKTAIAGKWQLGRIVDEPDVLQHVGFDQSCVWGWHEGPRYWNPTIWQNGEVRNDVADRYGPDVYTDFLIQFMEQNGSGPFLAYYPMCLPHFPKSNEPPGPNGKNETFAEMVAQMDRQVGRLMNALKKLDLHENTLVLFTSDNGSPTNVTSIRNGKKVKGGKAKLTDAGTHVPLIAHWPGTIKPDTHSNTLVDFTDFLPTLTEIAQASLPTKRTIDGHSFAWALRGQEGTPRDWVFTEWNNHSWIRTQDWKLYEDRMLYDLREDPEETTPLSVYTDDATRAQVRGWLESEMALLLEKK